MLVWKTTHLALLELEKLKAKHLEDALQDISRVRSRNSDLTKTVKSQQDTIAKLTAEILILKGTVKATVEHDNRPDPLLAPDIVVTEENQHGTVTKKVVDDVHKLQEELEKGLAEIAKEQGFVAVSPEALAEATISTPEEWKEQHRVSDE